MLLKVDLKNCKTETEFASNSVSKSVAVAPLLQVHSALYLRFVQAFQEPIWRTADFIFDFVYLNVKFM